MYEHDAPVVFTQLRSCGFVFIISFPELTIPRTQHILTGAPVCVERAGWLMSVFLGFPLFATTPTGG